MGREKVVKWAGGKKTWQMTKNYMLILLLNIMIRAHWTGSCSCIFPLKTTAPPKEQKGVSCSKGTSYSGLRVLREPFQLAAGSEFSMKLESKNLAAGDNRQRFQKVIMESEDNYQGNVSKTERRDITES